MKAHTLLAALCGLLTAGPATADQKAYQKCIGAGVLPDGDTISWTAAKSALPQHLALRASLKAPMLEGQHRILRYASGGDLSTTTYSLVAVRAADGKWIVDTVGQSRIWIKGAIPTPIAPSHRTLSAEDSRKVDAALENPCLYTGPTFQNDPHVVGGLYNTLEVETPRHRWVGGWHGWRTPEEDAITQLIAPR